MHSIKENYFVWAKLNLILVFFVLSFNSFSQTTIHSNDCSSATTNWTFYDGGGLGIQQGGYWLLDNQNDYIISEAFDVSSYINLTLTFKVGTHSSGANNPCLVEYSTDNGATWSTNTFTSATPTNSTLISAGTWNIGTIASTTFKLRWTRPSSSGRGVRIDDIEFKGTTSCTPPTITVSATPSSICNGSSSTLSASGASTYLWDPGSISGASIVVSPSTTTTYTVTATQSGCTATSTVQVTVHSSAPSAPTAGTSIAGQTQINWDWSDVASASGYQWNTSNTYPGAGVNLVTPSDYTQTGLTCETAYNLYVWSYNVCGYSSSYTTLNQTTSTCSSLCIDEDFESFPDWTNNGTNNDNTHCAPNDACRALAAGSSITSPPVDNPSQLSFMQDASSGGNGKTATIDYKIGASGTWTACHSFTVSTSESVITVDLTNIGGVNLSLQSQVYFRFNSSFATWYLDDVKVTCGSSVSNTITTGTVSSPPFTVNCSSGASGNVSFTSSGTFNSGNIYRVELSNSSGSFASPIIIGTLTSTANSGTISINIPAAIQQGTGYKVRVVSTNPAVTGTASSNFTINLTGGPCSCFEIVSILVDACDGSAEGRNEMFRFVVGQTSINVSDISVTWPNPANSWKGLCQNATTASIVSNINATITGGGQMLEPPGGIIPAGAQVMFFTNTNFNYTMFDFSSLNYTLYAIFQCPDNTPGHFANHNATNPTYRTLIMKVNGCGSDTVTYNAYYVYAGDGATVDFDYPGNPTYSPDGNCSTVPLFPLPVELMYFKGNCSNQDINLYWATASETNNAYFTVEIADDVNHGFKPVAKIDGSGNSNIVQHYSYKLNNNAGYYRLKQTDFDGNYSYSDIISVNCDDDIIQLFPTILNEGEDITIIGEVKSVRIFDSLGRTVLPEIINNTICCLSKGFYFVVINDKFNYKVLVQ